MAGFPRDTTNPGVWETREGRDEKRKILKAWSNIIVSAHRALPGPGAIFDKIGTLVRGRDEQRKRIEELTKRIRNIMNEIEICQERINEYDPYLFPHLLLSDRIPALIDRLKEAQMKAQRVAPEGTIPSIKVGDVVRLKSGGPEMTVVGIKPTDNAEVCWYENGFRTDTFPLTSLNKVS